MESEIRSEDWASLVHSRGSAVDIPDLLMRILRSAEYDDADRAVFELGDRICHQGVAVSEATSVVLPHLLRIAENAEVVVRPEILLLVEKISRSSHAWRSSANNSSAEHKAAFQDKVKWELSLDEAFHSSFEILDRLAQDADHRVSQSARTVLKY